MQCAEKPRTVEFYKSRLASLLASDALTSCRIDCIDEAVIEEYVQRRGKFESRRGTPLSPGSINQELATLRRLLRLAHEWKEIKRVPRISGKAKSKKVPQRTAQRAGREDARALRALNEGACLSSGDGSPWPNSHLGQQHSRMQTLLKIPSDFVLHSLRHTFGTRLGEFGADAFTIMRLMGQSTVTVSRRCVHPSPEAVELAYERMTAMNLRRLPTNSPTVAGGDAAVAS
jgi:site-specific recombinase XerD